MSGELWILVGVVVGLLIVFGVYRLGYASKTTAVASGIAVITGGLAVLFARRRPSGDPDPTSPPPTIDGVEATLQPVIDAAHEANDSELEDKTTAVDTAMDGPSPEEDLAALGDSRRRHRE